MDVAIDSSKLPEVLHNPAVPVDIRGKELINDIFSTYSLKYSSRLEHDSENILYKTVSSTSDWEQALSTKNFTFQKYLSGKPIIHQKNTFTEKKQIEPQQRVVATPMGMNNFIIAVLLFCFILLAWLKYSFSKYLQQISHSIINYSESVKLHHDHNALVDRVYFVLNLIFVFTGGLFIYNFLLYINTDITGSPYMNYLLSCAFIIVILFYRIIMAKVGGFILKQKNIFEEFNHSNLLFYKATGIVLLPLTALLFFTKTEFHTFLLFVNLSIFLLFFIVSIFRASRIMLQKGVLLFYWILYLCTIEIIPLLLLLKYLNNSIKGL